MKTKAVRLYGKNDLRLEEFDLAPLKDDEVRVKNVTDSICMSSYKAAIQGADHKRVPDNVAENPIIIGHEFCGEIIEVGAKWQNKFEPGQKFVIQPAHNYQGSLSAPGYTYRDCGGDATYNNIPFEIMEMDCLIPYENEAYFLGSLAEPLSCVIGAFHANYHTKQGVYKHEMGIKEGGHLALLASVGPMGLAAIAYALATDRRPAKMVVTDIDQGRLDRAAGIYTVEYAKEQGVELIYKNTGNCDDPVRELLDLTDGQGYDDVLVFAPVPAVVEQGERILGHDGCLNFFAGPSNPDFYVPMNFYNVHYASTHVVGTSGGNNDDLREAVGLMSSGKLNAAPMVTHILGLNDVAETTLNLPKIPGGKKLVYPHIEMELTAISEFAAKGETDPRFKELAEIMARHNQIWNVEAEKYVLQHFAAENA